MTKKSKAVFFALPLLIFAGVAVFLFCSNQGSFTGSCVKNPDAYLLDIKKMNGTDLHTLELCEGDILQPGVNYLYVQNGYSGGLTPLLGADGKPVITK